MADSTENAGSSTVSGSKEAMEVPKNFKDLRKRSVRNIAQYSGANVLFSAFFHRHALLPYYPPCLQERVARHLSPRFGAVVVRSAHDCETHLLLIRLMRFQSFLFSAGCRRSLSQDKLICVDWGRH